jgi:hypothetical protein
VPQASDVFVEKKKREKDGGLLWSVNGKNAIAQTLVTLRADARFGDLDALILERDELKIQLVLPRAVNLALDPRPSPQFDAPTDRFDQKVLQLSNGHQRWQEVENFCCVDSTSVPRNESDCRLE